MKAPPLRASTLLAESRHGSKKEKTCLPVEIDMEDDGEHHGNKCYNATLDFVSLMLAIVEIGLVIYLSISHFTHQRGIIALAMLAPIVLNFVGVTYFFSDKEERMEFERVGVSRCAKDIFQVPVLGPVFTAMKVLSISSGCSEQKTNYARFEASAIKMKQAESFFGAAPEALVQLTVLLVSQQENMTVDNYLEIAVVIVSVITLAEANMYGMISNYYKLFHEYECGDWKLPPLSVGQKFLLFLHSFTSIGARIAAVSFLKSAVKYFILGSNTYQRSQRMANMPSNIGTRQQRSDYGPNSNWGSDWSFTTENYWDTTTTRRIRHSVPSILTTTLPTTKATEFMFRRQSSTLGTFLTPTTTVSTTMTAANGAGTVQQATMMMMEPNPQDDANKLAFLVVGILLVEIVVRIILFYVARLIKYAYIGNGIPSGCYESVNYGWRATILDFGYQSKNIFAQIWFYVENCIFFALWWFAVRNFADPWIRDAPFSPLSGIFLMLTILSIFLLLACRGMELHFLKAPFNTTKK